MAKPSRTPLRPEFTGQTSSPERYNIPDQTARYVRVTVHGNSENDLGNINEMSVRGRVSAEQQTCTNSQNNRNIRQLETDGHIPQNTLDNKVNTRWSNLGLPSWIQYNLGSSRRIMMPLTFHGLVELRG